MDFTMAEKREIREFAEALQGGFSFELGNVFRLIERPRWQSRKMTLQASHSPFIPWSNVRAFV